MASTNKTTNYELSQYIGTDKPTYLTDYNQDMSKIDAGIHAAKSEADTNSNSIGDLTSLTTTAKTSLVASINEVDTDVATNTNNIATNTSNIATNTTHIGTLPNLTTSSKTDLVVATNEVNAKAGNLSVLQTQNKSSLVSALNEIIDNISIDTYQKVTSTSDVSGENATINGVNLTLAKSDNEVFIKIYGTINFTATYSVSRVSFPTNLNISEAYSIDNVVILKDNTDNKLMSIYSLSVDTTTNWILMSGLASGHSYTAYIIPCLLLNKDFGDITPAV